jgi:hypothetical protein
MQQQEKAYRCTDYVSMSNAAVRPEDRQALCDWGYQTIAACNGASRSTAVTAFSIFDRFLSSPSPAAARALADIHDFQLAFVACLVIALKVRSGFKVETDFVSETVCGNMYCPEELNEMEMCILKALQWKLNGPTSHDFIDYYIEAMMIEGIHREFLTRFSKALVEIAVTRYSVALQLPSEVAFTAICCALEYAEFDSTMESLSLLQLVSGLNPNDQELRFLFKTMIRLVHTFLSKSDNGSEEIPHEEDEEVESVISDESPTSVARDFQS